MPVVNLQLLDGSGAPVEGKAPLRLESVLKGDAFAITLAEETYEGTFIQAEPGVGWLTLRQGSLNKVVPFCLLQTGNRLDLWVDGQIIAYERVSPGTQRSGHAQAAPGAHNGEIRAPLPGMILKILVQAGDAVERNAPLVVLESMKMETTLTAPMAATVQRVLATEGQMAQKGMNLIQLTPLPENASAS